MEITVIPRYLLASQLVKPCTLSYFDEKKMFQHSAFARDSLRLLELVSHDASPQEKVFHRLSHSVLAGFGTHHEFPNTLTTNTKVPP